MHQKRGRLEEARSVLEPLAGRRIPGADLALANVLRDLGPSIRLGLCYRLSHITIYRNQCG